MLDKYSLKLRQAMPLQDKIRFTERRIHEWVEHFGVNRCYVSFSGGKDSTVLLYIVRSLYPDIEAVFVDTGLEYPEIRQFVKSFHTVTILRPEMRFDKVLEKYGYPIISKEVSEAVYNAKLHLLDGKKYKTHFEKLNGLGKYSKEKEQYACKQWKFLLKAPFKISNKCCNVMKKKTCTQLS